MAVSKYIENNVVLWKVYVHVRSSSDRKRRIQKTITGIKSEAEARREEKKLIQKISKEIQHQDNKGLVWATIVNLWEQEVKMGYLLNVSRKCADEYVSIINKWTKDWSGVYASDITKAEGRDLILRLQNSDLSQAYQKKIKNIINNVFEWGIEYKHIKGRFEGPMKGLIVKVSEEKPPDILTLEEIKKFLLSAKILNNKWYSVWSVAILTGMRSGELHALTWDQIDLEKNLIMVDRSYDSTSKTISSTKGRYWRTVPINASLRSLLIEIKVDSSSVGMKNVLPRFKEWDNGDQAVPLKTFLKSINVKPIKFHALRACFATQMLANGVPAAVVMKIGGWKKSSTMDIYLRLAGVDTKGATDSLGFIPTDISFGDNVVSLFSNRP